MVKRSLFAFSRTSNYAAFTRVSQMGDGLIDAVPELIHNAVFFIFNYILANVSMKRFVNKV